MIELQNIIKQERINKNHCYGLNLDMYGHVSCYKVYCPNTDNIDTGIKIINNLINNNYISIYEYEKLGLIQGVKKINFHVNLSKDIKHTLGQIVKVYSGMNTDDIDYILGIEQKIRNNIKFLALGMKFCNSKSIQCVDIHYYPLIIKDGRKRFGKYENDEIKIIFDALVEILKLSDSVINKLSEFIRYSVFMSIISLKYNPGILCRYSLQNILY